MAHVYGLYSCRDGLVRYVGETYGDCADRFKGHLKSAEFPSGPLYKWFHEEWHQGFPIRVQKLQWCKDGEQKNLETDWISKFPNLLNRRKDRWWQWNDQRKYPAVPEIVAFRRGHIFNVHGYRGIHYSTAYDRFRVMVYTGRGVEWLRGDELPGGSPAVWFLDSTTALDAREKRRKYLRRPWLPDLKS